MRFLVGLNLFFFLVACQQTPTKTMEETANPFELETVLVDTRSAFLYESSHIQGSVHLESGDYLILKNPKTKKRILDPDLTQTIERLSKKGLHPSKKIILISELKNSEENKKWAWFLKLLGIENIQKISMDEFRKLYPNKRYADPHKAETWDLKLSPELQQEFILKKAPDCFVSWSEHRCKS